MTFADIERKVRTLVNDNEASGYRFQSTDIYGFILDAIRHLHRIRPSTRYVNGLISHEGIVPAANTEIPVGDRYEEALVAYTAYKVYQLDMSDTVNLQMAETLKARAEALMQI